MMKTRTHLLSQHFCSTILTSSLKTVILATGLGYGLSACASEEQFNDALRVAQSGDMASLEYYQQAMQGDYLGYYPEYWMLNNNLASQPAYAIQQFAQKYPNSAMAEKLSADYVEAKVKIGDYHSAQQLVSYVNNADLPESCAIAQAELNTGKKSSHSDKQDVFLLNDIYWNRVMEQKEDTQACKDLANHLMRSQQIAHPQKLQRIWGLLLADERFNAVNAGYQVGLQLSNEQLAMIEQNPQVYLWSAGKHSNEEQAYLIYAMGRLAKNNLSSAFEMVEQVAQGTPAYVTKYLYRTVAYMGGTHVMDHGFNREVVNYFKKSEGIPFSLGEAEIYARQAIRFSEWNSVLSAIEAMPKQTQQEDRWRYWTARAYEQLGHHSRANQIYKQLSKSGSDYHHLWAKSRLGEPLQHEMNYQPNYQDESRLNQNVHFQRAFTLKNINAPANYTNREWNWAVRQAVLQQDDGMLIAAAKRADNMGWYDRSIYAAERTVNKHNYQLRYPENYRYDVVNYSQNVGINPAWAYGIIRQESRFNENARSPVGAIGLMQVMPSTGRTIAREMGESYSDSTLRNPQGNIRYGTHYLSSLLNRSGSAVLATAGYNGGLSRANNWRPQFGALQADQYAESIPIVETRNYVKHVMTNATHYSVILGQGNTSILQRMQPINP